MHELLDKKKAIQAQSLPAIRLSSSYYSLEEGLRQYSSDLNKLQVTISLSALDGWPIDKREAIYRHKCDGFLEDFEKGTDK